MMLFAALFSGLWTHRRLIKVHTHVLTELSHRLDHQHSGHDGAVREVTSELCVFELVGVC